MCSKDFVKRVVPFFLTFAVGLFIASFFVSIAAPNFQFNRGWRKHRQYHRTIESENQRLRDENFRLKKQLAEKDAQDFTNLDLNLNVQPPASRKQNLVDPVTPHRIK